MLDAVIIGGGAAALSAALYLSRGGKKVEVFERNQIGGDLGQIPELENYPGYQGSGEGLAKVMREQAEQAGAKISYGECHRVEDCAELRKEDPERTDLPERGFCVLIDDEVVYAKSVLVACGAESRRLDVELNVPVSYCALCDGELAKDKKVAVVGGANSAIQEALYLAPMVKELTVITHSRLKAGPVLQERLRQHDNVKVLENLEATAELLNKFEHVFVFIGKEPKAGFLQELQRRHVVKKDAKFFGLEIIKEVELIDEDGYIITGAKGKSEHETAQTGLYAAGDIRQGAVCQVITAAGDGAATAIEMLEFLNGAESVS